MNNILYYIGLVLSLVIFVASIDAFVNPALYFQGGGIILLLLSVVCFFTTSIFSKEETYAGLLYKLMLKNFINHKDRIRRKLDDEQQNL